MRLRPQLVGLRLPAVGVGFALLTQMLGALRRLQIGGVRAGLRHHPGQQLGVFQHGTGAQVVAVKGLPLPVQPEQRLLQALQEALVADIRAGIVDKNAGLHVARGIDVAIDAAAGYAAAGKLAVVLEVDAVELLAAGKSANFPDAILHIGALLRRQQQVGGGIDAHGHIVEVPREHAALADQQVEEFVAGDHLIVLAGVADGHAEGDAVAVHQIHGVQRLLEVTLPTAPVVGLLEALHADGHKEVAHPQHLLTELLVDEGAVGEGMDRHVPVLFAQADDILLPQQRLAAGKEAGVGTQCLGLCQHPIHLLKGQALLVAVLRRPAAGAVHIAGGGRVHQDEPRHVDAVLGGVLLRRLVAPEAALIGHVGQEGLEDVGIVLPDEPLGVVRPLPVGVLRHHPQRLIGLVAPCPLVDLLDHVDELLGQVTHVLGLSLFQHGVEDRLKGLTLRCVGDLFGDTHWSAVLSFIQSIGCFMCFFR